MTYDKFIDNNDQWYAVIPAQVAGQTVYWYLYAHARGASTILYYSNSSANFKYTTTPNPPDLYGTCSCGSAPATTCTTPNLTSYGAAECELDGGAHCFYPPTVTPCMYGCFGSACGAALSFLGNTISYQQSNAFTSGATIPANQAVTVVTQTYPPGSVSGIHLVYSNVNNFLAGNTGVDLPMTYDKYIANNDQWYGIIPPQASGATVYWYIYANGFNVSTTFYYSNTGNNFSYSVQ